ncbi:MAG: hypothetical protein LBM16_01790 [Clostridiales bacterium]|jgi:hypothetical protein|nr:hypothetical protein [Clostridiales bacterium]
MTLPDESNRPENWNWVSVISVGEPIRLTAVEWNDFCSRINEFRNYSGLAQYSFLAVHQGDKITAAATNQALSAILEIPGHGDAPAAVSAGDKIYAELFNKLRDALNAIP